jgi:multidrug efflux pump subunit AcrA (membrane-fusion protein)
MSVEAVKKKITIWVLVITVVVGAGLYAYYNLASQKTGEKATNLSESLTTAVVRNGDLTILTSGSGEVIPAAEIELTFDQSGTVLEILVQVGDQVDAGQVLAILQSDKTDTALAAEIAAAELVVVQAQAALDDLYTNAEMASALALIDFEEAQLALEDLKDLELEKALALQAAVYAEEAIENAQMLLYIYNSSPSEDEIYTAYASWLFKQKTLDDLTKQVNATILKMKGVSETQQDGFEDQLMQLNLQQANQRLVVEDAIYRINTIDAAADPVDVAVAESQLATAQAELAAAQKEYKTLSAGPQPGELTLSEAQLAKAQAEWEHIQDGPDPDEVTRLETQLKKAKLDLEILREQSTVIQLVAPVDGTVTMLNLNVGDRIDLDTTSSSAQDETGSPQTEMDIIEQILFGNSTTNNASDDSLVTLADLSQPMLEVYIDESDFTQVGIGYPVGIIFNALPDDVFTGEIIEISPSLETVSNVNAIRTVVLLDRGSYNKPNTLPIGLSAQVDVIAGQALDAVLIPVEALIEVSPGEYMVYVVENDQIQHREVSVGLVDFTSAEIIDGLSAGEVVAIGYENNTGN